MISGIVAAAFAVTQAAGAALTISAKPERTGGAEVRAVAVRLELRGEIPQTQRPLSFRAPVTYASVRDIANRIDSLVIRDASGVVEFTVEDDAEARGGFPYYRHWRAKRNVVPPVAVTYRMRPFAGQQVSGPQFDLYAHGGGISTGGMALFVLPEVSGALSLRLNWDLSDLASGSTAASTYGDGNIELNGPAERLAQAYYMAGPLGRYTPPGARTGFTANWLGDPTFDAPREMAWAYDSYEYQRRFYRDTTTATYRVFIRALPVTAVVGGTALQNSFMVGVPAATPGAPRDTAARSPRGTIAHEMGHMWVGTLAGPQAPWYNEGLNVYYTRRLMLRAGLTTSADFEREIATSVRNYYTSPFRNASADALNRAGFSVGVGAGSAQNLPYVRGSLYFADLDARMREASGGKRTLDDLVMPLLARRRAGTPLTQAIVLEAIVQELGADGRTMFDAVIIRGETLVPVPNAFGPCFERKARQFDARGAPVDGYEWVRIATVPEATCREW